MTYELTEADKAVCQLAGIEVGVDEGTEDTPQRYHLCWPYDSALGALCGTSDLGSHLSKFDVQVDPRGITCDACVRKLAALRSADQFLLRIVGRLAKVCTDIGRVDAAADEYIWGLDHKDEADRLLMPIKEMERELRHELASFDSSWAAICSTRDKDRADAAEWHGPLDVVELLRLASTRFPQGKHAVIVADDGRPALLLRRPGGTFLPCGLDAVDMTRSPQAILDDVDVYLKANA